jgi:hypothetical protein
MVAPERWGNRPSEYSEWHRTLSEKCLVMDADWIEYRVNKGIVAVIETALKPSNIKLCDLMDRKLKFEVKVLFELQTKLKVPCYVVWHTEDLSTFYICTILSNYQLYLWKTLGKKEYVSFIEQLGEVIV